MSSVNIPSYQLKLLCDAVVSNILKIRKEEVAWLANKRMKECNNGFFHKLFKIKNYTIEEFVKEINDSRDWDDVLAWEIHNIGWNVKDIANRLLPNTRVADVVTVSSEDIEFLVGWAPEGFVDELFKKKESL